MQLDSISGVINSNINIEGDLDEVEKSIVSGSFELLNFELTDLNRRKLIGLNKMNLSLDEIDSGFSFLDKKLNLLYNSGDKNFEKENNISPLKQIKYGEEIGLGSPSYQLIEI